METYIGLLCKKFNAEKIYKGLWPPGKKSVVRWEKIPSPVKIMQVLIRDTRKVLH